MQSFVRWHGQLPRDAKPIEDFQAREHAAAWIRRNVGDGVGGTYVIGYVLRDCWWTLFFDRVDAIAREGVEAWKVESYGHDGRSWSGRFYYWPDLVRWRHVFHDAGGGDCGRYQTA